MSIKIAQVAASAVALAGILVGTVMQDKENGSLEAEVNGLNEVVEVQDQALTESREQFYTLANSAMKLEDKLVETTDEKNKLASEVKKQAAEVEKLKKENIELKK